MAKTGDYSDTSSLGGVYIEGAANDPNFTWTSAFVVQSRIPFWRRLWVVVSAVPRYLIMGRVELP